jgi:inhibitor of cysteine peptidase
MNRNLLSVLGLTSLLAVSLLAGCAGVATYTDAADTITTTVDGEFIIALDSNPSTGYSWNVSYDASLLSLEKEEYNPDKKEPGLVGAGGTQYYQFKALKAGSTEVNLTYLRTWEEGYIDRKVFTITIS